MSCGHLKELPPSRVLAKLFQFDRRRTRRPPPRPRRPRLRQTPPSSALIETTGRQARIESAVLHPAASADRFTSRVNGASAPLRLACLGGDCRAAAQFPVTAAGSTGRRNTRFKSTRRSLEGATLRVV